jgi:hypothetical protein
MRAYSVRAGRYKQASKAQPVRLAPYYSHACSRRPLHARQLLCWAASTVRASPVLLWPRLGAHSPFPPPLPRSAINTVPCKQAAQYYAERTVPGTLMITEVGGGTDFALYLVC